MRTLRLLLALAFAITVSAGTPMLKSWRAEWAPYVSGVVGGSNAVVVLYKSTSLGTVWTPFKRAGITPATRTNLNFSVLPGTYRFYLTAIVQPYGESEPSITVTNRVSP